MNTKDFPAGHSMDTDWFAVDKNGNVAIFNSCSEGAVPIEIETQTHRLELLEKYTTPVTSVLKQLFLDGKVIEYLLQKCNAEVLEQIIVDKFAVDGCIVLLNENKKWEDLNIEKALAKKGDYFGFRLSSHIPLYLISDIYDIRKEMITAIKNKVIAKACNFSSVWDDEDGFEGVGMKDLGIFVYDHDNRDWRTEPYYKINTPEFPLKANQFVPDLADKIPYLKDITFENQDSIQPMEYFSCESYVGRDENIIDYAQVVSSDNEEVYCLLSVTDQIYNLTKLGQCNKCYPEKKSFSLSHHCMRAYQDYPPIVIIEDDYYSHNRKWDRYQLLMKNIYNALDINKKDCVQTCCEKCFYFGEEDNKQNSGVLRVSDKFQHCHTILNTEIATIQPLLIIAIDDTTVNLLKTKYEITGFSTTPCLCSITVENKQYPLLTVNNVKTKEEQAILTEYLSAKSDKIKTILAQLRNLPPLKPRVMSKEFLETNIDETNQIK